MFEIRSDLSRAKVSKIFFSRMIDCNIFDITIFILSIIFKANSSPERLSLTFQTSPKVPFPSSSIKLKRLSVTEYLNNHTIHVLEDYLMLYSSPFCKRNLKYYNANIKIAYPLYKSKGFYILKHNR